MVKISFQSVAGQKVEKESDGDKTEILIPHPMASNASLIVIYLINVNSVCYCGLHMVFNVKAYLLWSVSPAWWVYRKACSCTAMKSRGIFDSIYRHLVGYKTCHCCEALLCATASMLIAGLMQVK